MSLALERSDLTGRCCGHILHSAQLRRLVYTFLVHYFHLDNPATILTVRIRSSGNWQQKTCSNQQAVDEYCPSRPPPAESSSTVVRHHSETH
jgi:hypothetical protein